MIPVLGIYLNSISHINVMHRKLLAPLATPPSFSGRLPSLSGNRADAHALTRLTLHFDALRKPSGALGSDITTQVRVLLVGYDFRLYSPHVGDSITMNRPNYCFHLIILPSFLIWINPFKDLKTFQGATSVVHNVMGNN